MPLHGTRWWPFSKVISCLAAEIPSCFQHSAIFETCIPIYYNFVVSTKNKISNTPKGPLRFSDFIPSNSWPFWPFSGKILVADNSSLCWNSKAQFLESNSTPWKKIETESFFESKNRMQRSHFFGQGRRLRRRTLTSIKWHERKAKVSVLAKVTHDFGLNEIGTCQSHKSGL